MRVFVAGATGVLGRSVVPRLLAAGHQVTAIARSPERAAALEQAGAHPVQVDLFDPRALTVELTRRSCQVVINLATHIPTGAHALRPAGWAENDRLRTVGSAALVDASIASGVEQFVQEGVSFVYADGADAWIDEGSPIDAVGQVRSVLTAAAQAERFAGAGGTGVVLWFGQLYGDDPLTRSRLRLTSLGLPATWGDPEGWVTSIHCDDAGAALVAALDVPSGRYNIGDTPIRHREQAAALAEASGRRRGRGRVAGPRAVRLAGEGAAPLARSHRVSSGLFREATGWAPDHPTLGDGLQALRLS